MFNFHVVWQMVMWLSWRINDKPSFRELISFVLFADTLGHDGLQQHTRLVDVFERHELASPGDLEDPHHPAASPTQHRQPRQPHPRPLAVFVVRLLAARGTRVRHRILHIECREGQRGGPEGTARRRSDRSGRRKRRKLPRRWRRAQRAIAVHHQPGPIDAQSQRWVRRTMTQRTISRNSLHH